jgi:pimeloyl-ACP methyl ester carboxylesterase
VKMLTMVLSGVLAVLALLWVAGEGYGIWARAAYPAVGDEIRVDGRRVHVRDTGPRDGPCVVLIHGASANVREWEGTLRPRLDPDMRVIAIDRPGHGYTARRMGDAHLGQQAEMISATIKALGVQSCVLVGHSFGGAVALRVALDHPQQVSALVLSAPASHPWPGTTSWYNLVAARPLIGPVFGRIVPWVGPGMAEAGVASVFLPQTIPDTYIEDLGLPLLFRPRNFIANGRDMAAANAEFAEQAKRYPEIEKPLVVFSGTDDDVLSPVLHAGNLKKQIAGAIVVRLDGVGHMPHHVVGGLMAETVRSLAQTGGVQAGLPLRIAIETRGPSTHPTQESGASHE